MTRFIVDSLRSILLLAFWIMVLLCGFTGGSLLQTHPYSGFVLGCGLGFVIGTLTCGGLFVLIEINDNLRILSREMTQSDDA